MKKQKKYYLIYQITNNINHKIYIGKHKTDRLDDDYFGSGQHLRNAQEKYGLENFTKTILFYCANEEEMNLLEKMVVTPEFCAREDVYNIMEGGNGGWNYVNLSSDYAIGSANRKNSCRKAAKISLQKCRNIHGENATNFSVFLDSLSDEEYQQYLLTMSNRQKTFHENHPGILAGKNNPRFGKKNSQRARMLISAAMKTDANFMKSAHHYVNYELKQNLILHDGDVIPAGFELGYCLDFDKHENKLKQVQLNEFKKKERQLQKEQKQNEAKKLLDAKKLLKEEQLKNKLKLLSEMQQWYVKFGWKDTVKKFNYSHTIQAFSQQYIKYFGVSLTGRKLHKRK